MVLIKCPECGKEISNKSSACVACGCPMVEILTMLTEEPTVDLKQKPIGNNIANVNLKDLMAEVNFHKGSAILKLNKITGKSFEECKEVLDKPFEDYISQHIDIQEIMKDTEYSKVRSIEMLRTKTGLSLAECKLIFDEPYKNLVKPHLSPIKNTTIKDIEYKRKCNSCGHIFLSSKNICTSCNSINTTKWQEPNTFQPVSNELKCPRCGSIQITSKTKGFGLGKAAVGGLLLGPVGLLGGVIGSKKVKVVCLNCGKEWNAGY